MLEAFVDKLQGRQPLTWISPEDTIANMEALEMFYETVRELVFVFCCSSIDVDLIPLESSTIGCFVPGSQSGLGVRPTSEYEA